MPEQVLIRHYVAPVILTGVVYAQQHLAETGHGRQGLQGLGRQRGNAKHHHPARQPGRAMFALAQVLDKARMHPGPAAGQFLLAHIGEQGSPQRRLPAHGLIQRHQPPAQTDDFITPLGPTGQPVGPIHLILIEQIRQPLGQLIAFAIIGIVLQKTAERRKYLIGQQTRQQSHQPPGQRRLVEWRQPGNGVTAQHGAIALPQKTGRQVHLHGRRNAATAMLGQRQLQPLGDTVALHQYHLVFQRGQRVAPHPGHRQFPQLLQVVAVHHHQPRRERLIILHSKSLLLSRTGS